MRNISDYKLNRETIRKSNTIVTFRKYRQVKKIITVFTKQRNITKNVQVINDYLRKPSSERLDPKELDLLLGEITIMHSRAELYIRFLRRRIKVKRRLRQLCYVCIWYYNKNACNICFTE